MAPSSYLAGFLHYMRVELTRNAGRITNLYTLDILFFLVLKEKVRMKRPALELPDSQLRFETIPGASAALAARPLALELAKESRRLERYPCYCYNVGYIDEQGQLLIKGDGSRKPT